MMMSGRDDGAADELSCVVDKPSNFYAHNRKMEYGVLYCEILSLGGHENGEFRNYSPRMVNKHRIYSRLLAVFDE